MVLRFMWMLYKEVATTDYRNILMTVIVFLSPIDTMKFIFLLILLFPLNLFAQRNGYYESLKKALRTPKRVNT